jgi:putative membrane protein
LHASCRLLHGDGEEQAPLRAEKLPSPSAEKLRFIRKIIHGELAAIIIILLCAAIMARGGWV